MDFEKQVHKAQQRYRNSRTLNNNAIVMQKEKIYIMGNVVICDKAYSCNTVGHHRQRSTT